MLPERPIIMFRAVFKRQCKCFYTDGQILVGPTLYRNSDKTLKENRIYVSYLNIVNPDDPEGHIYEPITRYGFKDVIDMQNCMASICNDFVKAYNHIIKTYPVENRLHPIYSEFDFDYPSIEEAFTVEKGI